MENLNKLERYECFLQKMRQEVVQLDATIKYLTGIRDELNEQLEEESES
jgi:SMC interacting uncharacterized protein involved in chromosome segregation